MPRKAFVADLKAAIESFSLSSASAIHHLRPGDDDGTFTFIYNPPDDSEAAIEIEGHVDVDEYPSSYLFFIYTKSYNVSSKITKVLENFPKTPSVNVSILLCEVELALRRANTTTISADTTDTGDGNHMQGDSSEEVEEDEELLEDGGDSDLENYLSTGNYTLSPKAQNAQPASDHSLPRRAKVSATEYREIKARIRADLRAAKAAGFRASCLGNVLGKDLKTFITLSVRILHLGISEEALQAWHLDPQRYLVLIFHYPSGYASWDMLLSRSSVEARKSVHLRVRSCTNYKPTYQEALRIFSGPSHERDPEKHDPISYTGCEESEQVDDPKIEQGPQRIFVDSSMQDLLNVRLIEILRYRTGQGIPWKGAEEFYNAVQGGLLNGKDAMKPAYYVDDNTTCKSYVPKIVIADHLRDTSTTPATLSFPLMAMQFTLRHVVRCTEFCLVCHSRVESDFEALKPYVCSNQLCLYQYMTLGMGPDVEHEVLKQPHVVDLLISFCYASAHGCRLKFHPLGLEMRVPNGPMLEAYPIQEIGYRPSINLVNPVLPAGVAGSTVIDGSSTSAAPLSASSTMKEGLQVYQGLLNEQTLELVQESDKKAMLRNGDWICISSSEEKSQVQHYRVLDKNYDLVRLSPAVQGRDVLVQHQSYATVRVQSRRTNASRSAEMGSAALMTSAPTTPKPENRDIPVTFVVWATRFDELDIKDRCKSMCMLLDTLPSVRHMAAYLTAYKDATLAKWNERIPLAALSLLRWIIASNRSCILQVDSLRPDVAATENRVVGLPGFFQFRFAQGAPDKEQRFVTAVREVAQETKNKYPTFFAWHGSALRNWHGIVREGLVYDEVLNGRAYGDGVYHALDVSTSLGYSSHMGVHNMGNTSTWANSDLQITQAICLNEIVNAPDRFVSRNPYLVVQHVDWIQTRYLFVRSGAANLVLNEKQPAAVFEQDPLFTPVGNSMTDPVDPQTNQPQQTHMIRSRMAKLVIPITAVSGSRRPSTNKSSPRGKKRSSPEAFGTAAAPIDVSDDDDDDDQRLLVDSMDEDVHGIATSLPDLESPAKKVKPTLYDKTKTNFAPNLLNYDTLPILSPPSYATSQATRSLQRLLLETIKIQDRSPAHELGWYIDPQRIENVYQWIVELHSFPPDIPLARDLSAKNLRSIVLELRFGKDFPFSPPFVRVIRPRFLTLAQGGGGHVTAGGAMCMELLTSNGWSAVNNIESVLLQVRMAMMSTDPHPAKLVPGNSARDYTPGEAMEAYVRACTMHGWTIPVDFKPGGSLAADISRRPEDVS
ncbi:hypothetical protein MMC25_007934 [Agyrium rufum]|nr:hypothetical protein [Agyrium rufum]